MKGIIFAGCSFTWGQGLYYYSGLDTLKEPLLNIYDDKIVTSAHKRYTQAFRFPRIVSNYFKTFEIVKNPNGGSEDNSIEFLDTIFDKSKDLYHILGDEKFSFSEIEYIIFQTSQSHRNVFEYYDENNIKQEYYKFNDNNKDMDKKFLSWLPKNFNTFEEWNESHIKNCFNLFINKLKSFEEKGIKTLIISYPDDYINLIKNNKWANDRFITLEYKGKTYDTILQLMDDHKNMIIHTDFENFENSPKDMHPSLKCHQVIADNIIKKIENTNEKL